MTRQQFVDIAAGGGQLDRHVNDPLIKAFDESWGNGFGELDPSKVSDDLEKLTSSLQRVRKFANKTVAHIDMNGRYDPPTFGEFGGGCRADRQDVQKLLSAVNGSLLDKNSPLFF